VNLIAGFSAKRAHPLHVAMVGVGAESECAAARDAVKVVEENVVDKSVLQNLLERAGAFGHFQRALINEADQLADEITVFGAIVNVGWLDEGAAGGAHGVIIWIIVEKTVQSRSARDPSLRLVKTAPLRMTPLRKIHRERRG
jgi:hypothetical protein